jgi:hypothetical protein
MVKQVRELGINPNVFVAKKIGGSNKVRDCKTHLKQQETGRK